jgi:glycerol-3-phosphate dehydrogenase subunit C
MNEGSLKAPERHTIPWENPDWLDPAQLDAELRRVFDLCHTCRRCFNLCESFPRLFDLIDGSPTGELDEVKSEAFAPVIEACTLCDMCFMTKCPYVPPHEWNIDFPHLMLRGRMAEAKQGKTNWTAQQLAEMDRNGKLAGAIAPIANWGAKRSNKLTRPLMERTLGIDREAELPKFASRTLVKRARTTTLTPNSAAPAYGKRKAALFATCFVNYNKPETGEAALKVLNHIGIEMRIDYPGCCGMPFLEQAELGKVAEQARTVAAALRPLIDQGYDIITPTASCGLMFKFEWPLIVPDDDNVKALSKATFDIDEYVVDVAKKHGLPDGLSPIEGGVTVHLACHARAQNVGAKAVEMLRLIPGQKVDIIERCAGHGGTFGVLKETRVCAVKVGTPAFRAALKSNNTHLVSDCPLAASHLVAGTQELAKSKGETANVKVPEHPIELLAQAYGV